MSERAQHDEQGSTTSIETPQTDLQTLLSKAVDAANALPKGSVYMRYDALVGLYVTQIISAVVRARAEDWNGN